MRVFGSNIHRVPRRDLQGGGTGATGATGPQGLVGQTGPQGPAGPSNVRFAADDIVFLEIPACADTALDTCSSLLAVGMTPGDSLVTATANIDNANAVATGFSNRCGLFRGDLRLELPRLTVLKVGSVGT